MGLRCWNYVINSYSKLSCIFYSLTFGVDMEYMSMLDIWNQSFYVFLVRVGAAILLFYFRLFVCFSAFVVCIFSDEHQGCSAFRRKLTCLHPMNAKQKNCMVWYYRITCWSDIKKRHRHPRGSHGGLKCQISTSAKF